VQYFAPYYQGAHIRTLTYYIAVTLDGFIAGPDGADPTGPGGFWPVTESDVAYLAANYPETLPGPARQALSVTAEGDHFDTVLEGRRSYQLGLDAGRTDAYPHLRHVVFSRTLTESPDPAVELVGTDPVAYVRELKRQPGRGIWLIGGAELAAALRPEIDRLIIKRAPIAIGAGIPLFAGPFAVDTYRPVHTDVLDSGVVVTTYERHLDTGGA
jgi:dihydrofolate reductase